MKIGIYDSGLGGVTIFKKILKNNIKTNYIYLADNKNAPYGIKDKEEVKKYIDSCVKYLVDNGCSIIVIACNTATALMIDYLRIKYPNIYFIGTEPAIKMALDDKSKRKILVTATTITLKEEKLKKLILKLNLEDKVDMIPLDKLVYFAENNITDETVDEYLKEQLLKINLDEFSHIVLGCTHFPLFIDNFKRIVPTLKIVDSSSGVAKHLKDKLDNMDIKEELSIELLLTESNIVFENSFKNLLGISKFYKNNIFI